MRYIRYSDLSNTLAAAIKCFKVQHNREPSQSLYNDWLICIRGVFDLAVKGGAIKRADNPALEFRNKTRIKTEPDPFDPEEADLTIELAYEKYGEVWGAWFELGFYSGMRYPSEPSALTWEDVDLRKKEIRMSNIRTKTGIQKTTKTGRERTSALTSLKAQTYLQDSFIFVSPGGKPVITADPQRKQWRFLLKKLGIRYRDMYNMRHTYATFGLMSSVNPGFMASQLGHSIEEFFNTYAKWINAGQNQVQIDLINQAIKPRKFGIIRDYSGKIREKLP